MAEEEKLVEAMARALCVHHGQYECIMHEPACTIATCPMWRDWEEDAHAALAAAREAGWELIQETDLTELRRALSEAESSVDYYYENYTE